MAILFIDLDRFKSVNDRHGHRVGDDVLVAVAQRVTGLLRPGDTLARLSGDEFVVMCEDIDNEAQARTIAQRAVDALAVPFSSAGCNVELSASVGVALANRGDRSPRTCSTTPMWPRTR